MLKKIKLKIDKDELKRKLDIRNGTDGKDGRDADEKKIIEEVIKKIPNGKNVDKKEIIKEVLKEIPKVDETKITETIEKNIKTDLPKLGEKIRDGLELLQGENRLDKTAIQGIKEIENKIEKLNKQSTQFTGILGIKDITAGTNITIDKTNQQYPVINAIDQSPVWGAITGTLSNQTDLQNALDAKVSYTGATGDVDLGNHNLYIGIEGGQGNIIAPDATTNDTLGSNLNFIAGNGFETSGGGSCSLCAGEGGTNGGDGGSFSIDGGIAKGGDANGGNINLNPGLGNGTGTDGKTIIKKPSIWGSEANGLLDTSLLTIPDKTFTFPNTTGTIALTSDIISDHTLLSNIGTNTHAQIDTHLAAGGTDGILLATTYNKDATDGIFLCSQYVVG